MFKNYFHAFMNLAAKYRLYLAINLLSLAVGLTAVLLIALFVGYELSFDRQYADADRLYRLNFTLRGGPSGERQFSEVPAPVAPLLMQSFDEVEQVARFGIRRSILRRDDLIFYEDRLGFADNAFFDLFDLQWLAGDPRTALQNPSAIVLTRSLADKYFGDEDPLGKTLVLDNTHVLVVTGLIADFPANTHLQAGAIATIDMLDSVMAPYGGLLDNWNLQAMNAYVRLKPGADWHRLASGLPDFERRYMPANDGVSHELGIKRLTAIHLHPEADGTDPTPGSLATLLIFSTVALTVLVIAVVNFVNLSIARYTRRIREVGVRKSAGASRGQLIVQFLGEAMLISLLAMIVAAGLAELVASSLPFIPGGDIQSGYFSHPAVLFVLVLAALGLGAIAGFYPALYLSSFRPVHILRGSLTRGKPNLLLRNTLILAQFAISITIVIVAVTVHAQMKYTDDLTLGYDPDDIVEIATPQSWNADYAGLWAGFRNRLLQHPGITNVTHAMNGPLQLGNLRSRFRAAGEEVEQSPALMSVGFGFFRTYGMAFLAGRDFSPNQDTDLFYARDDANRGASLAGAYILNEQAVRDFGWTPTEALGKTLYMNDSREPGTVIGVVGDTVRSGREGVLPAVYINPRTPVYPFAGTISLRMSRDDTASALAHVDAVWQEYFPESPVVRTFLGSRIDALYQDERQQGLLFRYFAVLSIFLSCAGLLGLAAFNAECRTKEIGIRKVLGGSVWNIVLLLTNDFSGLVLASNLIAWPVAYYTLNQWLANFAYRIDLAPLVFVGSSITAFCIAWVTVGGTAAKAASQQPVLALRYE